MASRLKTLGQIAYEARYGCDRRWPWRNEPESVHQLWERLAVTVLRTARRREKLRDAERRLPEIERRALDNLRKALAAGGVESMRRMKQEHAAACQGLAAIYRGMSYLAKVERYTDRTYLGEMLDAAKQQFAVAAYWLDEAGIR